jgi:Transposase
LKINKKGPSKENRKEPIIGMGLLLDEEQVPLTMKMYPGNESEKPILRQVINDMKKRHKVTGRTIQVADKGLNCAKNIIEAIQNGDGYIYSQSVKMLESKEKNWVLLDKDYQEVVDSENNLLYKFKYCIDEFPYKYTDEKGKNHSINLKQIRVVTFNSSLAKKQQLEINKLVEKAKSLTALKAKRNEFGDSGKYVDFKTFDQNGELIDDENTIATINQEKIDQDLKLAGYNMIISSETKMNPQEIYSVYHRLWRIEETFRLLKTSLDARPVHHRKKESIYGHFLICYLSIFALRVLQLKAFKDEIHPNKIIEFVRNLNVIKINRQLINLGSNDKISSINNKLSLNMDNYVLSDLDIKKVLNFKF